MSEQPILRVNDLCTFYGSSQALFDVGLSAPRRGAVAVLGRNGAGKTTLLKTIAGELRPQKGEVEIDGKPATRLPTEKRIRAGLGGASLQATALVHEVWLKLSDNSELTRLDSSRYYATAAQAMRWILVDRARRRSARRTADELCVRRSYSC